MRTKKILSATRLNRFRAQGYTTQTDTEITKLAFGNRFAFRLSTALLAIGIISGSTMVLSTMFIITLLAVILPNHPFDYIYNEFLAEDMNKPNVPKRSAQLKFAWSIAAMWIGAIIFLFATNLITAGYVMGTVLLGVAFTVSITDFCVLIVMYNYVFHKDQIIA